MNQSGQRTGMGIGSLRDADKHAKEVLRLWQAGEQWFPSPPDEVNMARAYLLLRGKA